MRLQEIYRKMTDSATAAMIALNTALDRKTLAVDSIMDSEINREIRKSRYELGRMELLRAEAEFQAKSLKLDMADMAH